jgi:hypothetical protein
MLILPFQFLHPLGIKLVFLAAKSILPLEIDSLMQQLVRDLPELLIGLLKLLGQPLALVLGLLL